MYFLYALVSVLAYSIHNALMAPLYREMSDKLSAVFYRGMCISISFSPALFFVPQADFLNFFDYFPSVLFAAVLAVIGTWSAVNSVNFLAIGVANTLLGAISNIFIVIVSVFLLGEGLNFSQVILIALILASVLCLGFGRSSGYVPASYDPMKGFLYCLVFSFFTGSAFVLIGLISRNSNPILVGYLWESLVGICSGISLVGRWFLRKANNEGALVELISYRMLFRIFLCSAPAGIGTACYAYAMTMGSIAIVSAVLNLCMVVTTILTVVLYGERLSKLQWGLLSLICFFVTALRLVA